MINVVVDHFVLETEFSKFGLRIGQLWDKGINGLETINPRLCFQSVTRAFIGMASRGGKYLFGWPRNHTFKRKFENNMIRD